MPLSIRFFLGFSALALFVHELHELAHTLTARAICGAWGARDFNSWQLAEGCTSWVPTVMGPLLSYTVMYAGIALMRSPGLRSTGIALALAPNPFARLFTAVMGGGDEMLLARVIADSGKTPALRVMLVAVVAALALPPMVAAWRAMRSEGGSLGGFATLLLAPMALTGILYFVIGNRMLAAGLLTEPRIGGDPLLVFLTTVIAAAATAATFRWTMRSPIAATSA